MSRPQHDTCLDNWWDGNEEVFVAFYHHPIITRDSQSFVILFAYAGAVLHN